MSDREERNNQVVQEFRANKGKVGGPFEGRPMILITTTGAKSGRRRTIPLVYLQDGERRLIFASKGGAPTNPDWYHNLLAHPDVTVEVGDETYQARAVVLTGDERDRVFARQAAALPTFADYQARTKRTIPVIALERS